MTIRTRLFLVFALAMIIGFSLLGRWLNDELKAFHNQSYEEVLVDTANLFAEIVADDISAGDQSLENLKKAFEQASGRDISAQIYGVNKKNFDLHVYVTDPSGKVIFDSISTETIGEDFSEWRDVRLTLEGKYGARTSDEIHSIEGGVEKMVSVSYVAAPIISDGVIIGVVSVGKPKTNIEKFVESAKKDVINAIALSIIFALGFGLLLYLWLSKPLARLVAYAEAVSRGERVEPPMSGGKEIRNVAQSMAEMRKSLEDRQYVERYVQNLTHEIKSPLTAIIASAELLEKDLSIEKRKQFSANIIGDAKRLSDFADQLLELASLEKLDQLLEKTKVDISELLSNGIESVQTLASQKSILIKQEGEKGLSVEGNEFLLAQAFENLLRNAIDFSREGSEIIVSVRDIDKFYEISVSDEGEGIPEYAIPKVFDRFYSLPRASGKKSTGLGLNFVLEVAELHSGSISLENRSDGKGAIAKFRLNHINSTQKPH